MSADDILFDPIGKPADTKPIDTGIVRRTDAIDVEIKSACERQLYTTAAEEVMDHIVGQHLLPGKLVDVRQSVHHPHGVLDLTSIVGRFHDGQNEMWVSCPKHMPADLMRFVGRFGYHKVCHMPRHHGSFGYIYWPWIDTNNGQLPGIDLGIIMVPVNDRWWRVFENKSDATSYYQS